MSEDTSVQLEELCFCKFKLVSTMTKHLIMEKDIASEKAQELRITPPTSRKKHVFSVNILQRLC